MTIIHAFEVLPEPSRLSFAPVAEDWFGVALDPPVLFSMATDATVFLFAAKRSQSAMCHPDSRRGEFQAELWKYDVAEFFLSDPVTGHYLEFNLAPNGGWWSCEFRAPLQRVHPQDEPVPGVVITAEAGPAGWLATASLPLAWLRDNFHFGPDSRLNATFILDSPHQRFLTASPLGDGPPAFHQPAKFPPCSLRKA